MAKWDEGYVTDVAYVSSFYREITPAWLTTASLVLGHRAPDLAQPFSYADLGCGNGFTTLVVAATCPQAVVWGFDFNPAHIEFARRLADQAGLRNVRFVETSFAELARLDLPDFDFIVAHGVLSWISQKNRRHLLGTVAKRLKPGGLVYLSYNVTAGWAAMVPLRRLMRMLTLASPERTDLAVSGALEVVNRLKDAGALFFPAHPQLEKWLADLGGLDDRYIAHEYLNEDWHPLPFADVASEMHEAKCDYIGSATLAENIDTISVPAGVSLMLAETHDPVLREMLRDIGGAQSFRRDLYRKGVAPMSGPEQQMRLHALTIASLGVAMPEDGPTFTSPIGDVTGRPEIYQPLMDMLESGWVSVEQAMQSPAFAGHPWVELLQAFSLLIAGGYAHPVLPPSGTDARRSICRRLNLAIAQTNAHAADLPQLVSPVIGSAVGGDILETLIAGVLLNDGWHGDEAALTTELLSVLGRTGRSVRRDGQPITDPADRARVVGEAVAAFLGKRLPVLRNLGVL